MKFKAIVTALAVTAMTAASAHAVTKVPEGTEFPVRMDDKLSSKTSGEGDRFSITLSEDVKLPDGTVLREGYKGVGEITKLEKNGMLGKSGTINVRLNYLKVGDARIRLRASKGNEGKGNAGNMIAAIAFGGVFGLLVKGHSAEIPKGAMVTAYADEDAALDTPVASPPRGIE